MGKHKNNLKLNVTIKEVPQEEWDPGPLLEAIENRKRKEAEKQARGRKNAS